MVLIVPRRILDEIVQHSKEVFPTEACGLMIGRSHTGSKLVEEAWRAKNILDSSSRYQLDPEEQLKIFQVADSRGKDVVGVYHSHPFWEAYFSEIDRSQAFYPSFSYLIYSVRDEQFRSFVFAGSDLVEEELRLQ